MTTLENQTALSTWEKSVWNDEPAWKSIHQGVCAIISESRSRLVYLGAIDGYTNLLNAPLPLVMPDRKNPAPNLGGHRFWLGRQHQWVWPPPADWEHSAAESIVVRGGVLVLTHPNTLKAHPAITREYSWEGRRLRCTARWRDDGKPRFGLHVVAVDAPATITARIRKTHAAPEGLVAARMVDPEGPIQLPHPSISIDGECATVRTGIKVAKLGFPSQPLVTGRAGGWRLCVAPGTSTVATSEAPDHGYLSQLWVGDASHDIAELEQITPVLKGDASGCCSSTIYIEALPPSS